MSPAQRRTAHIIISDEGFASESIGVGDERRIVIKKSNA
jgi:predicted RNA-binding protein Jag